MTDSGFSWTETEVVTCPDCGNVYALDDCWLEEDEDMVLFPIDVLHLPCRHAIAGEWEINTAIFDEFADVTTEPPSPENVQYYLGREALPEQTEHQIRAVTN